MTDRASAERLLAADPTEEWVADEWAHRSSESDRASAEGLLSDAHWAIETLRRNERTEPDSPFWQGWDAALAAIEVALRDTGSRTDSGIDVERLALAEHEYDPDGCDHTMRKYHPSGRVPGYEDDCFSRARFIVARLSTPRTETSDGLLDAERDALL